MRKAEILTSIFLICSFSFIAFMHWLLIRIGVWSDLWNKRPDVLIFIVSLAVFGIIASGINEFRIYRRLKNK